MGNIKSHFSCLQDCSHAYHVGDDITYFHHGATDSSVPRPPHYRGFMIALRHTTFGRTPLDEWSVRRRDLYLTTHTNHNRQTSMLPAGFEPTIPASERPQTHALDRAATTVLSLKQQTVYFSDKHTSARKLSVTWRAQTQTQARNQANVYLFRQFSSTWRFRTVGK
jgi:hypothetical protein